MLRKVFPFWFQPRITYGITVCNEANELDILLATLIPLIDKDDEIIILQDVTHKHQGVCNVIEKYKSAITSVTESYLNGDFATFKNNLIKNAHKDYLFQIDADEIPTEFLIKNIKSFLKKHRKYDVFSIPRINTVEGITDEYIQKWNWKIDANGYINYPDYQHRILKVNEKIRWKNKVHEVLSGYRKRKELPAENFEYCLLHPKKIERQIFQNDFYDSIG